MSYQNSGRNSPKKLNSDKASATFLDTTFLLPFFQVDVKIEGFTIKKYKAFLTKLSEIHISELSIYEAKAKIHRLSRKDTTYMRVLKTFGANLATLREDEKIIFHPYTSRDDEHFNIISSKNLGLDSFDIIILAQALDTGMLITEDKEILSIREKEAFLNDPALGKTAIKKWKEINL